MTGAFMPGIFDAVNKLRIKENIKDKKSEPRIPRILNQKILTVPSEDIGTQRLLQDKMKRALDTMHTTLIDDISSFIDRQIPDVDWLTSPTNFDLITSRFKTIASANPQLLDDAVLAFLKLLAYFCLFADFGTTPDSLHRKAFRWWQEAQPVIHKMRLGVRESSKIDPAKYGRMITNEKDLDKLIDNMKSFRDAILKDKSKKRDAVIKTEKGWTSPINALFTSLMTNFSRGTRISFENIEQKVSLLGDLDLNRAYYSGDHTVSAKDAKGLLTDLKKIVKKHTGSFLSEIPQETAQALAESNPTEFKDYGRAKVKARNAVKAAFKDFVRSTGKEVIPADMAIEFYTKHDFPHSLPTGFNGKDFGLDEDGNQYFKGIRLSEPVIGGWIKGNPMYNPKDDNTWLVRAQGEKTKEPKTIRSFTWTKIGREDKKKGHVEHNENILPQAMQKWREHMEEESALGELSHLVELLYSTGARIGSEHGNTDGEQTFGISSLKKLHFSRGPNGSVVLSYKGKKGVSQTLTIKPNTAQNKSLIRFIVNKAKNKKDEDWLFTEGNSKKRITDSAIRKYMKDHLDWSGGPHKLRSIRANKLFNAYLKKHRVPANPNQTQLTQYWKEATQYVGDTLGHIRTNKQGKEEPTGTTAAQSYIDKDLQRELFRKYKVRIPSIIA